MYYQHDRVSAHRNTGDCSNGTLGGIRDLQRHIPSITATGGTSFSSLGNRMHTNLEMDCLNCTLFYFVKAASGK